MLQSSHLLCYGCQLFVFYTCLSSTIVTFLCLACSVLFLVFLVFFLVKLISLFLLFPVTPRSTSYFSLVPALLFNFLVACFTVIFSFVLLF